MKELNMAVLTEKERLVDAIQGLPADATIEDAMERLLLLAKIDRGIREADSGQTISHADVKQRMAKWLN